VRGEDLAGWFDPLREANVGTLFFQWGVVLAALLLANRWLARHTHGIADRGQAGEG
jgi:hypothetical protein